ncbi:MAG: ATPase, T2SS/T4P/T4SS family [bacterium]|nr:ATPase, T2SS/T4P/T4SS family [bacterium]
MIMLAGEKDDKRLEELREKEEEELVQTLSDKYGIPYIDLSTVSIETEGLKAIPEAEARKLGMAAFKAVGRELYVALLAPNRDGVSLMLEELKSKKFVPYLYMASKRSLERAWSRYKEVSYASETKSGILDIAEEALKEMAEKIKDVASIKETVEATMKGEKGHKISRMLEIVVGGAIGTDASDVHIEPEDGRVRLRFRLDGVLIDVMHFDFDTYHLLNSRLKLLSQLKLNVKDTGQDGRFSIRYAAEEIEVRVSFVPGAYGESIVLRILNPKAIAVPFESLGISEKLMKLLEREIGKPNGIILTTGPTGSGKTTTLYAFLRKVYTPGVKIITIEDPVEYHLQGIVQTQTDEKKGYTFLEGLRSALRQDPDILMVGEIRDGETAKIAINSALTGHLVFSTLHTNTAAGAIPRLIDLGVNPKVISSALNVAIAQRLVRKLCPFCRKEIELAGAEKEIVEKTLARMKEEKLAAVNDVPKERKVYAAGLGCVKCGGTGYKGRIGLFEAIMMDEAVEKIITENPSEREIKKAALPQQIPDMAEDGVLKVLVGITSLDEVRRVVEL